MDIFQTLNLLKTIGMVTAGLALVCAVPAIVIAIKTTPAQLKAIIHTANMMADPKHRKAAIQKNEEEQQRMEELFRIPDTSHLSGWLGTVPEGGAAN